MRVYLITEDEMEQLREAVRFDFLEHCAHHRIDPLLNGGPEHSQSLYARINMTVCRWRDRRGDKTPSRGLDLSTNDNLRLALTNLRAVAVGPGGLSDRESERAKTALQTAQNLLGELG